MLEAGEYKCLVMVVELSHFALHCEQLIATSTNLGTAPKDIVLNRLSADSCRWIVEGCHTVQQLRRLLHLESRGLV